MAKSKENTGSSVPARTAASPFASLHEELDQTLRRFFGDDWPAPRGGSLLGWPGAFGRTAQTGLSPRADMVETEDGFELTVELPGMDQKDIELTLQDDALVLKGEKKEERETQEKDYHVTERSYGRVRRVFAVPPSADAEQMRASFDKGVLRVQLPKAKEAKARSRRIEVKGG